MKFLHSKIIFDSKNRAQLESASASLYQKLQDLNTNDIQLSAYGLKYLKGHLQSLQYLFQMYTYMLDALQRFSVSSW